jgi:hypothetical protein
VLPAVGGRKSVYGHFDTEIKNIEQAVFPPPHMVAAASA